MTRIGFPQHLPLASLVCASVLLVFLVGFSRPAEADESESGAPDVMEEIVVYGDKSLSQLRREMHLASEAFFDVYNELNSDDDFDIQCDYETTLGDRRRNHVCRPRFAVKAEARETAAYLMSGHAVQRGTGPGAGFNPGNGYVSPIAKRVHEKEALMWQEVSELLALHPEFRDALNELLRAKNGYESERERRRDD
jgi:hypothetical protein